LSIIQAVTMDENRVAAHGFEPRSTRDIRSTFVSIRQCLLLRFRLGNLRQVTLLTTLTSGSCIEIPRVSTLDRQSLAAAPYGFLSLTKSIADQGIIDEHPRTDPASVCCTMTQFGVSK